MNTHGLLSLFLALTTSVTVLQAQTVSNASNHIIQVEGTTITTLRNAVEVLQMLPGVNINIDNQIVIDGKVGTAVYIGTHKVADISELYSLQASSVKSVEILRAPGSDYGKDVQSVIIFKIIEASDNGLSFNNDLNLSFNNHTSLNDEFHLGYKHNKLNMGAYVSWTENRNDIHEREFVYAYNNAVLEQATIKEKDADARERKIVTQADLGYNFSDNHKFNIFYRLETMPYKKEFNSGEVFNYKQDDSKTVDFSKPAKITPIFDHSSINDYRHAVNAEYHGKCGNWNIDLGHNSMWYDKEDMGYVLADNTSQYILKSYKARSYLKTSVPLWHGSVSLGLEHNMQTMNVKHGAPQDLSNWLHIKNGISTLADYLSVTQKWGKFQATAGIRHEYNELSYRPYDDDALGSYLDQLKNDKDMLDAYIKNYPEKERKRIDGLMTDGKIVTRRNHFYPDFSMSYDFSAISILSLSFSRSYHIADLELSRMYFSDFETASLSKKLLHTEHIYNTTVSWWYDWLLLSAVHNYYEDPLCVTNDSKNVYNGNSYHSMDLSVSMAPQWGRWQPMLMAMYSQQWFDIALADGRTSMTRPRATIHFNNVISLPHDWIIHANAEWYSRGDYRNVYYYKSDFNMNLSIQKEMLNKHLSLALKVSNLFHSSYKDITTYNRLESGVSNGAKSRKLTTVTISAKYTL